MRDDELLEPILDEDAVAVVRRPRSERSRAQGARLALPAALLLVAGGLGAVGGWRIGVGSGDGANVSASAAAEQGDPDSATRTAVAVPASPPPHWNDVAVAAPGWHGDEHGQDRLEPTGRRTTAEGIVLRTFAMADGECRAGAGNWCPPPECRSGPGPVVQLSTDGMVGHGGGGRRPDVVAPAQYVAGWSVQGIAEGDPVLLVVARVPVAATQVELVGEGARRDVADPADRWVALAMRLKEVERPAPDGSWPVGDVQVVARDGRGRELARTAVDGEEPVTPVLPWHCEPPGPPLAAAGEQPPDPDRARAEVQRAYEQAWSHTSSRAEKLAALHDPVGVEPAMARAATNYGQATGTTRVELGEIVFTSPVQAQLHYRLVYEGAPGLGIRNGGAVLVDGRWKVLRSSFCEILAAAGAPCGAGSG